MVDYKENGKKFCKKWLLYIIILIAIIIFVLTYFIINKNKKIDNTSLSSYEVKEFLESKGYTFYTDDYDYIYNTHYIIIKNTKEGIWIQKYINEIIGTEMSFKNTSCNNEFADIESETANKTDDEKKQYEAYINWLNDMGLSKSQIVNVLNYYDQLTK